MQGLVRGHAFRVLHLTSAPQLILHLSFPTITKLKIKEATALHTIQNALTEVASPAELTGLIGSATVSHDTHELGAGARHLSFCKFSNGE
jgi:hypothetical protein